MSQKVLKISAEDAKYIDPNQVANLTMVDGSTIFVRGNDEGFVEEIQEGGEQYDQQGQQQVKQPALRGLGTNLALGAAALGAAALGAAALGKAAARPMGRPGMMGGPGMMRGPGMMGRPGGMMMGGPGGRFRGRHIQVAPNENGETLCPLCKQPIPPMQ